MTFSYTLPFATDTDRVRFHLGDTDATAVKFSDEEIAAVLTEAGDYKAAVLMCIRNLIARLSQPDFKADWLQVSGADAVASWRKLYAEKAGEFGLASGRTMGSGVTHVVRGDSDMTGW